MRTAFVLLVLACLISGCGDPPDANRGEPAPRVGASAVPAEVIARLRDEAARHDVDDSDASEVLTAALDLVGKDAEPGSEERQLVLTAWMRTEIVDGRVEAAKDVWRTIQAEHAGEGRTPTGQHIPPEAMAAGLAERAVEVARSRLEGSTSDAAASARAMAVAEEVAADADDPEVASEIEVARRWLRATRIVDFPWSPSAPGVPRVVVLADDFVLGEAEFLSILKRWNEAGAPARLVCEVVPLLRGTVRAGIRRVPAEEEDELRTIRTRVEDAKLLVKDFALRPEEAKARLGLPPGSNAVFLVDASGRIVARASGPTPELRPLEPAFQRLASR